MTTALHRKIAVEPRHATNRVDVRAVEAVAPPGFFRPTVQRAFWFSSLISTIHLGGTIPIILAGPR